MCGLRVCLNQQTNKQKISNILKKRERERELGIMAECQSLLLPFGVHCETDKASKAFVVTYKK